MIKKFNEWVSQIGATQPNNMAATTSTPAPMPLTNQPVGNQAGEQNLVTKPEIVAMVKLIGMKTGDPKLAQAALPMIRLLDNKGMLNLFKSIVTSGGGMTAGTFNQGQQKIDTRFQQ